MSSRLIVTLAITLFVLVSAACGGDEVTSGNSSSCIEGEARACVCPEGPTLGIQLCLDDSTFGDCDCSQTFGPSGGGDNSGNGDAGSPSDTGGGEIDMGGGTMVRNECGGFSILMNSPGTQCGPCNDGVVVCDGTEGTRCVGETPVNVCGGCTKLRGAEMDPCGPCGTGRLECNGDLLLECVNPQEPNACGGCSTLVDKPGFLCQVGNEDGTFVCSSTDEVACVGPSNNFCGGTVSLTDVPATPCGVCDGGRFLCASPDAIICDAEMAGLNACGGCGSPLIAPPETACGSCGGEWQCDGQTNVVCSRRLNLCGGCAELPQPLGEDCGGGQYATCEGSNDTLCRDSTTFNLCGGLDDLTSPPGTPCGACGDGKYVCAGKELTACVEANLRTNACGGCTPLANQPGDPCAPGSTWSCNGTDDVECLFREPPAGTNACGGTMPLAGRPGTTCESCGTWTCDAQNPDLVFCLGGSPGTMIDANNCGMCGNQCLPGETCDAGACVFDRVVQIESSRNFVVARTIGGDIFGWGTNGVTGTVGTGSTATFINTPQRPNIVNDAIDVAAGYSSGLNKGGTVCAVRQGGDVWCWGDNSGGSLGIDPAMLSNSTVPLQVPGIDSARKVDVELGTVCAIKTDDSLWCWGNNSSGQVGIGSIDAIVTTPTLVLSSVRDVAIADQAVCALMTGGTVECWGLDGVGLLGNGSQAGDSNTPAPVVGAMPAASELETTFSGFVALTPQGVYGWGRTPSNQGNLANDEEPSLIPLTSGATEIYGFFDRFVIESGGTYNFFGADLGQTGNTSLGPVANRPLSSYPGSSPPIDIAGFADRFSTRGALYVLTADGSVFVSGNANSLGDGQLSNIRTIGFHHVPTFKPIVDELGRCFDGLDNDGDGLTDCEDSDCATDIGSVTGTSAISVIRNETDWWNFYSTSCFSTDLVERFFTWTAPKSGTFQIDVGTNSTPRTIVEVLDSCFAQTSVTCNFDDYLTAGGTTITQFSAVGGQTYVIAIEADPRAGPVIVDITEI